MTQPNILEIDWESMKHRRHLATIRRERESERRTLLFKLISSDRRAAQMRAWIASQASGENARSDPAVARMVDWAREQLTAFEAITDPVALGGILRERNLFPEVDELNDPLGEPPMRQPWGG